MEDLSPRARFTLAVLGMIVAAVTILGIIAMLTATTRHDSGDTTKQVTACVSSGRTWVNDSHNDGTCR